MNKPVTSPATDKPVVVLGAGGHARVLISLLKRLGRPIVAVLDDNSAKHRQTLDGVVINGSFDTVTQYNANEVELVNAIGSAGPIPAARYTLHDRLIEAGYRFATLVHPSAEVAPEATLEPGAQVMALAIVGAGAVLHHNTLVNTRAVVDHDTVVGPNSHIAPGATVCGGVHIRPNCHIGAGATIINNIEIGERVVVGAGATVVANVSADLTVVGTPAKPLNR